MAEVAGEVISIPAASSSKKDSSRVGEVFPLGAGGGAAVNYRMRAFDTNGAVNDFVYWDSLTIDSAGSGYSGSAGPLTDIVVFDIRGL